VSALPTRILVAAGVSVLAIVVLLVARIAESGDGEATSSWS
jgi:hypothetical protein